jgi:hypothetical protein
MRHFAFLFTPLSRNETNQIRQREIVTLIIEACWNVLFNIQVAQVLKQNIKKAANKNKVKEEKVASFVCNAMPSCGRETNEKVVETDPAAFDA